MGEETLYSDTFQLELLTEALRNNSFAVTILPDLKDIYFTKDWFKDIFRVLSSFVEIYKEIPANADNFLDHFKDLAYKNKTIQLSDNVTKIVSLALKKSTEGAWLFDNKPKFVHDKVNDFVKRAAMRDALFEAIHKLETGDYEEIRNIILRALTVGFVETGTYVLSDFTSVIKDFQESRKVTSKIATPFSELNHWINGGMGKGELFVVLSPPNWGKSLLMCNLAAYALSSKRKSIYYTLEMSETLTSVRLLQKLGCITQADMLEHPAEVIEKLERQKDYINVDTVLGADGKPKQVIEFRDIITKHYTSKSCTINTIYAHLALMESKGFVPEIIFVDYADLLKPLRRYTDKRNELSDIYTSLRDLAVEKKIAIVTASQTNRGALQKEIINMEDIAEDFGKIAIADVIVSINRLATEKQENKMRLQIIKNRDGEADKTIKLFFDRSTMTLGQTPGESDVENARLAEIMKHK